ncbi:hypothetical protein [Nostoc sp.]|uniref:hypothetical protein n=1 Tax=Nostoc sp. TaxID=1180 RepID=UPI002FF6D219
MKSAQTSSMFTSLTETEEASLCGGISIINNTKGTVIKGKAGISRKGKNGAAGKKVSSKSVKKVIPVKSITSTSVVSLDLNFLSAWF